MVSHKGIKTIILHLDGLRLSPANFWALSKIGFNRFRFLKARRAAPMSSAQALRIPAFLFSITFQQSSKKRSKARLNKKADPGQPWRTPERKAMSIYIYILGSWLWQRLPYI